MDNSAREPSAVGAIPMVEPGNVPPDVEATLRRFIDRSFFGARGAFITDLDGTVVFESQGTTLLAPEVEHAINALYELGRPLLLNSLRFPLSVMRTFGADWYRLSTAPIPLVSLNGSQIGFIREVSPGQLWFDELAAYPLDTAEVGAILQHVKRLIAGGITDILLFYYPRDWTRGEIIWTPSAERVGPARERYRSASAVVTSDMPTLRAELAAQEICMMLLLVDAPDDALMAYQHTTRSSFYTHAGVDKLSGAVSLARELGVDLGHSLGAGDTEMDRFLEGVGLALHVGPQVLPFRGTVDTIRLRDAGELAALLFRFAALERERRTRPATTPDRPAGEAGPFE
jgi:hydroxymethylpyrimidine pyrophosphatase-like HAD family hydrolase